MKPYRDLQKVIHADLDERFDEFFKETRGFKWMEKNIYEDMLEIMEEHVIRITLKKTKGLKSAASKILGMHRNTLAKKIAKYGIMESGDGNTYYDYMKESQTIPKSWE